MNASDKTATTIYALSTARGRAGVAVIRVSGPQARFALETVSGFVPSPRMAKLARLQYRDELIDEGLVLFFPGPHSFTGEDVVELHIHGSQAVIAKLFAIFALLPGLRLAEAGEFTKRALIAGKIDLIGAEALADLIDSETEQQRKLAIEARSGRLQAELASLRASLLEARGLLEASIDFSDEGDVSVEIDRTILPVVETTRRKLRMMLDGSSRYERLSSGFRIVLAGPVNAGKSTLLNALARRDVAIVSSRPGTTRDVLEVALNLNGWPITVIDTAGLRDTNDEIEEEGIRRAELAMAEADIVVHLSADGKWQSLPSACNTSVIKVRSQIDSFAFRDSDSELALSAKTGEGIPALLAAIEARLPADLDFKDHPVVFRERQRRGLSSASAALERIDSGLLEPELIAEELRAAADKLSNVIGDITPDEVLGEVFGRFCIGK